MNARFYRCPTLVAMSFMLFSSPYGHGDSVPDFAPDRLVSLTKISFSGTIDESYEGTTSAGTPVSDSYSYRDERTITTIDGRNFPEGTYSYAKTGPNSAILDYVVPDSGTDTSDETESGSISVTFTSEIGGTYTSTGTFEGEEFTNNDVITYSGSFNGSGTFTISKPLLKSTEPKIEKILTNFVRTEFDILTIINVGDTPITTTISSSDSWLTFDYAGSASASVTIDPKSTYRLLYHIDLSGQNLGIYKATISSSIGELNVPVKVFNGTYFATVVQDVTELNIPTATLFVVHPNGSNFIAVSDEHGLPTPLTLLVDEGVYRIMAVADGYISSEFREIIVTNTFSSFPIITLLRTDPNAPHRPPSLTTIPPQQTASGASSGPIPFVVADSTTLADNLTVTAVSSNQSLIPDASIVLGGAGAGRSISFAVAPGKHGISRITVKVTDGVLSASKAFLVTVQRPPVPELPGNPPSGGFTIGGFDDFDDNLKNGLRWTDDISTANAATFTEIRQRIELTSSGTSDRYRPWILSPPGYNTDWEVSIDAFNLASLGSLYAESGIGLSVFSPGDNLKSVQMEIYRAREGSSFNGFYSSLNGSSTLDTYTAQPQASLRIAFNSATKVLTCYHGTRSIEAGYEWTEFASYGIAGSGGTRGNKNWGMSGSQPFRVAIFGYSERTSIVEGEVYADNFRLAPVVSGSGVDSDNPIRRWQVENFTDPDSPQAALNFDGDFDGSNALIEYAFGTRVTEPNSAPTAPGSGLPGLPNISLANPGKPTPTLQIEYVRRSSSTNPGIFYSPEFSSSLDDVGENSWQPGAGTEQVFDLGNGWERVVIQDHQSQPAKKRFGRVKIIGTE